MTLPGAATVFALLFAAYLLGRRLGREWRAAGKAIAEAGQTRPHCYPPPAAPGHPARRLRKRIDVLTCGCTNIYDGRDKEWNVISCGATAPDLDTELRNLLDDQH